MLSSTGVIGRHGLQDHPDTIPFFNRALAVSKLNKDGILRILSIHVESFDVVAVEYGLDAFNALKDCFEKCCTHYGERLELSDLQIIYVEIYSLRIHTTLFWVSRALIGLLSLPET